MEDNSIKSQLDSKNTIAHPIILNFYMLHPAKESRIHHSIELGKERKENRGIFFFFWGGGVGGRTRSSPLEFWNCLYLAPTRVLPLRKKLQNAL